MTDWEINALNDAIKKTATPAGRHGSLSGPVYATIEEKDLRVLRAAAIKMLNRTRGVITRAAFTRSAFFTSGVMPPAFLKAWKERGMEAAGIRLFATGEATDDTYLQATGDVALGLVTSHHYSWAHPAARNRQFVRNFEAEAGPGLRPNYFAVTAYDGMSALAAALANTTNSAGGVVTFNGTAGVLSATSANLTGTAGAGFLQIANQSSAPSTPTSAGRLYWDSSNRLSWIGTNGFTRTFDGSANTANRTYTLPDVSSTFVMVDNPSVGVAITNANSLASVTNTALTLTGTTMGRNSKTRNR